MKFDYVNLLIGVVFLVSGLASIGDELYYKYGGPKLPDELPYILAAWGAVWLVLEVIASRKRK